MTSRQFAISGFGSADSSVDVAVDGPSRRPRERHTVAVSAFGNADLDVDVVVGAAVAASARPRLLALCGGRSNDAVTRRQLAHLGITPARYDIRCVHGPIPEEESDCANAGLFHGPFWSWLDDTDAESLNESLVNGVRLVLKVVAAHGPFDGVYGFCNGAIIATLAANVASDPRLRQVVSANATSTSQHIKRKFVPDSRILKDAGKGGGKPSRRASTGTSAGAVLSVRRPSVTGGGGGGLRNSLLGGRFSTVASRPVEVAGAPFGYVICACAGVSADQGGLDAIACSVLGGPDRTPHGGAHLVDVPSLHLIGEADPVHYTSEDVAELFAGGTTVYLPGGHAIEAGAARDAELVAAVKALAGRRTAPAPAPASRPARRASTATRRPVGNVVF